MDKFKISHFYVMGGGGKGQELAHPNSQEAKGGGGVKKYLKTPTERKCL